MSIEPAQALHTCDDRGSTNADGLLEPVTAVHNRHAADDWVSGAEIPPNGRGHVAADCPGPVVHNAPCGPDPMDDDAEAHIRPSLGVGGRHVDDRPACAMPGEGDLGDGRVKATSAAVAARMVDVADDEARHVRALVGTAPSRKQSENHSGNKSAALQHVRHGTPGSGCGTIRDAPPALSEERPAPESTHRTGRAC